MYKIGGFVIICLIITFGYGIGLLNFLSEYQEDKCEMTYMFEYPQYIKISDKVENQYKKYGLYAYGEGRLTEKARNMYFDGIPVLFIPGNAGSHKQVRSLASVALRKYLNSRTTYHFDYFTVDLNEEYSGLYGALLYDQLHFVNRSLHRILELYKDRNNKPESVIIVGHSIGGLIALKLVSEILNPRLIPLVITLSAPLKRPVLVLDHHMSSFYKVNMAKVPETTTVISLSGGYRDFLIPPSLCEIKSTQSLYTVTSNVPMTWIETNHIQTVWCKQLVMAINRALFDSIDPTRRQLFNSTYQKMAFRHHLVHHSGTQVKNRKKYFETFKIDQKGDWTESISKRYTIKYQRGVRKPRWHMVSLSDLPGYEILTILAINLETVDWIFACNANLPRGSSRICSEAKHLTHLSEIAPSSKYKRRYFQINMHDLKKSHNDLTHIVFRVLPTSEPVVFHVDIHGKEERSLAIDLPKWWSLKKHTVLERTLEKSLNYELVLSSLQHIMQFYQLHVQPESCLGDTHHASASLLLPWSNENYHHYFTDTEKKPMDIRLYSSRPSAAKNLSAIIKVTLDPSCLYHISIKASLLQTMGQIARTYSPLLLTNIAVVTLMSLRFQLKNLEEGYCSIIFVAINEGAKPYYVLTASKVISQLLSSSKMPNFFLKPDITYLIEEGTDFFLLPLLLYMCSVGIVWMLAVVFCISLITLESTVHKLTLKLLSRTVSFNMSWSDYLLGVLHKVPFVVATALVVLSLTTCGALALCLGTIFYFCRLTQMSQDFVEEEVWFFIKKIWRNLVCRKRSEESPNVSSSRDEEVNEKIETVSRTAVQSTDQIEYKDKEPPVEESLETVDQSEKEEASTSNEEPKTNHSHVEDGTDDERNIVDEMQKSSFDEGVHVHNEINDRIQEVCETERSDNSEDNTELSATHNSIFFHTTLFFLWCIVTIINIPAVLTWAHNLKYYTALTPDDSFIPGLFLSLCALTLWQFDIPKTNKKWQDKLGKIVSIVAIVSLMFATVSLYRLNYLLTFIFVMVTLHQLLAPEVEGLVNDGKKPKDDDNSIKYSDIKMKME